MRLRVVAVVWAACAAFSVAASADTAVSYEWPAPSDWYVDGFALPPPFAPKFPLAGLEQTEQAPGFGDPTSAEYWSYAFLWWIDGDAAIARAALERSLVTYYSGLSGDCADPSFPCDASRFAAHLAPVIAHGDRGMQIYVGDVAAYDPFFTGDPITLNVIAASFECPKAAHRAVLFAASPQPFSSAVWNELVARQLAFRCR